MSVLSNGYFNCLSITGRRATPLPAVPWAGSSSRPHPKGLEEGWRAGGLRARAIFWGWWWWAGAKRRVWARGLQEAGWCGGACGLSGVRCCERAWGLTQRTSVFCRPRALTRRSGAVCPAAEKNFHTSARIVCGRVCRPGGHTHHRRSFARPDIRFEALNCRPIRSRNLPGLCPIKPAAPRPAGGRVNSALAGFVRAARRAPPAPPPSKRGNRRG
ncbi:MAG: hypothetical protein BWX68_01670 [Verrucomicrobia bacterium ADurb.Bin063]|jgi:hypothetical protein|nr:MAG: hypothetical protein BWX68_01670 [Verrucomicrobia bacterium ADurb.Bin063]